MQLQILHSLFKSFHNIRYHNPEEIFTVLTQKVIKVLKEGTIDENLYAYALNRLGFMGQVENMKLLNKAGVEAHLISKIEIPQNVVMYLHVMAIHK